MNTTAAPLPWRIEGSTVVDAEGRIVAVLAGRVLAYPQILATICAAPEMRAVLLAIDELFSGLDGSPVMEEVRAVLDRVDGAS